MRWPVPLHIIVEVVVSPRTAVGDGKRGKRTPTKRSQPLPNLKESNKMPHTRHNRSLRHNRTCIVHKKRSRSETVTQHPSQQERWYRPSKREEEPDLWIGMDRTIQTNGGGRWVEKLERMNEKMESYFLEPTISVVAAI